MNTILIIFIALLLILNLIGIIILYKDGKRNPERGKLEEGEYEEFLKWYKEKNNKK